ncbi:D-alanyl-D-alanine carboxypeptidase/D-alanyl-D-alanine endopeptidase [Methanoplanus endosymbiosus]|uniref:D-alanyl-D-alanine carboxypeptidase/D-alanyl-D-alanine-endopeptidase n=1 Tax=Methanoplanus endosymbiosus TaxID=33865 RepID=A0A9E7TJR0_9EURY|nr:D-alanyl-D-alanine carboxypeptidase/D-alanyl-D-alanine-endopeptidase [Methanoplanus endosymbiosus]UUX93928.1 D-alanyl-D-alanine carboxypeptidase/D-alanyl-D-alanine-endopeptidase [Methanoplanus endosymbiosus]
MKDKNPDDSHISGNHNDSVINGDSSDNIINIKSGINIRIKSGLIVLILLLITASLCCGCTQTDNNISDGEDAPDLTMNSQEGFKEEIDAIISDKRYDYSDWGFMAKDMNSGEVLVSHNAEQMFTPGSTTKVFTVTTALDTLGPDYRFKTPVYYTEDNLILVASGDPAMGGRLLEDGTLEFTNEDHVDAGAFGSCILTKSDPLAGLNLLSAQIYDSGIRTVDDVVIDTRLFKEEKEADNGIITPIIINDNLIDITVTPDKAGNPAAVDWRPKSSAYTVKSSIITGDFCSQRDLVIPDYNGQKVIEISGIIPEGSESVNVTSNVNVPAQFARGLFIDALERAGITVKSSSDKNPADKLPEKDSYDNSQKVAELTSPPFSEYAKVTLKVSQNLYANCIISIIGAYEGYDSFDAGMITEGEFLRNAGINVRSLALADGEGSINNRISPESAIGLLSYAYKQDYYKELRDSMPLLGVDGTLAKGAEPGDPGYGKISAKTGTSVTIIMTGDIFVYARGLLGYMNTEDGNDIAFVIYANNVPAGSDMQGIADVVSDVNDVAVTMYSSL